MNYTPSLSVMCERIHVLLYLARAQVCASLWTNSELQMHVMCVGNGYKWLHMRLVVHVHFTEWLSVGLSSQFQKGCALKSPISSPLSRQTADLHCYWLQLGGF